jgi:hypothetical protein
MMDPPKLTKVISTVMLFEEAIMCYKFSRIPVLIG